MTDKYDWMLWSDGGLWAKQSLYMQYPSHRRQEGVMASPGFLYMILVKQKEA